MPFDKGLPGNYCEMEQPGSRTVGALSPTYTLVFSRDGKEVGRLDFNQSPATFTGDADESAKVFFETVCFDGTTYIDRIAALEAEVENLKGELALWRVDND